MWLLRYHKLSLIKITIHRPNRVSQSTRTSTTSWRSSCERTRACPRHRIIPTLARSPCQTGVSSLWVMSRLSVNSIVKIWHFFDKEQFKDCIRSFNMLESFTTNCWTGGKERGYRYWEHFFNKNVQGFYTLSFNASFFCNTSGNVIINYMIMALDCTWFKTGYKTIVIHINIMPENQSRNKN